MLTYTVYSEAGGVGKTTFAANLAVADANHGRDVLVVDLDPQEGSLSYLMDVADDRGDPEADHLPRHLIDRPRGDFEGLIKRSEGVDIVPGHNQLENLSTLLNRRQREAEDFGERFNPNKQLLRVLRENDIQEKYDTVIVDPPATADHKLYNAIHATRNLLIPFEPSGKGQQSVEGLEDLVTGLEENLSINVGVLAVVPNEFKNTNDQQEMLEGIQQQGFDVPVVIGERKSLFEGCWRQQCSAYRYLEEHRDRERDYELETLKQIDQLAKHLRSTVEGT